MNDIIMDTKGKFLEKAAFEVRCFFYFFDVSRTYFITLVDRKVR